MKKKITEERAVKVAAAVKKVQEQKKEFQQACANSTFKEYAEKHLN